MKHRRLGNSGLLLPELSLGLWHNFGAESSYDRAKDIIYTAFDNGITHFDLANNYGIPVGSVETNFGNILNEGLREHRDEIIISSKAGHYMWQGSYGDGGSRKHIITSCDQSLKRVKVDYFDIFYSHRHDPNTPLQETMEALDHLVKTGRTLYVGLSKYPAQKLVQAIEILRELKTPVIVNQLKYSLLHKDPEEEQFKINKKLGLGCVSFSPLAQGLITEKYLNGIPEKSRATQSPFLTAQQVEDSREQVLKIKQEAQMQGLTILEYALKWQLSDDRVTSIIVGVSSVEQLLQNINSIK